MKEGDRVKATVTGIISKMYDEEKCMVRIHGEEVPMLTSQLQQEIIFSNEELNELLVVLNVALEDANTASHRSRDMQEIDAYKQHKQLIRKWIHRFSALIQAGDKR